MQKSNFMSHCHQQIEEENKDDRLLLHFNVSDFPAVLLQKSFQLWHIVSKKEEKTAMLEICFTAAANVVHSFKNKE